MQQQYHKYDYELTPLGTFDLSKLSFGNPEELGKNNEGTTTMAIPIYYQYKDGKPGPLCLEAFPQYCSGIQKCYAYKKPKTPENETGQFQIVYPATSRKTLKNPLPQEDYIFQVCNSLEKCLSDHLQKLNEEGKLAFVMSTTKTLMKAGEAIKPIIGPAGINKETGEEYPRSFWSKLISFTPKGKERKFITKVYIKEQKVNPLDILGKAGTIHPVFKFTQATYTTTGRFNIQIQLLECSYEIIERSDDRPRMLPSNFSEFAMKAQQERGFEPQLPGSPQGSDDENEEHLESIQNMRQL